MAVGRRSRSRAVYLVEAVIAAFLAVITWHSLASAALAPRGSAVSIDFDRVLAPLPPHAVGLDVSVGDKHALDRSVPGLLRQAGVNIVRFPAGLTADLYHWQTHSATHGQAASVWPANTFDNLTRRVAALGPVRELITVNYGSNSKGTAGGSPAEAASWVRYANQVRRYGVQDWEIGNEVYGNGYYYYDWETDLHSPTLGPRRIGNPALSPTAYARNALQYIRAMKAQDPSIRVGVGLVTPGRYPDGLSSVGGRSVQDWNSTVLSIACHAIDFVALSWYAQHPGHESDSGLLASVEQIPDIVRNLRTLMLHYCGSRAYRIEIMVTETNSVNTNPGKQTISPINGLFLIEDYLSWLQAGVQSVFWWELHWHANHRGNNSSRLSGHAHFGDYGLLSAGDGGEPPVDTPFPSFAALKTLHLALVPGSHFVATSSSLQGVRAYALRVSVRHLILVLVNTTPSHAYAVTPTIFGFTPRSGSVVRYSVRMPRPVPSPLHIINDVIRYHLNPHSAAIFDIVGVDKAGHHG